VCRAARSGGAVNWTHATTQDNAAAAVRMLHLQVSSPIFHSDSITHSITMHDVRHEILMPKCQAGSGLCTAGCIALRSWCIVMLQAAHCSLSQKCHKLRKTSDNTRVNLA
jgi:hypothetical protein